MAELRRREQLLKVLAALRQAEFPRDFEQFRKFVDALRDEAPAGKAIQARWNCFQAKKTGSRQSCPPELFLSLLQADLRAEAARDWRRNAAAALRSPKRELAASTQTPALRAELYAEAEKEEAENIQQLADEVSGEAAFKKFMEAVSKGLSKPFKPGTARGRRKLVQRRQDRTPDEPDSSRWKLRMTREDFAKAAGVNRRTVERWLRFLKQKPPKGQRLTEMERWRRSGKCEPIARGDHGTDIYGPQTVLRVMAEFIKRAQPPQLARSLAADILARAKVHNPRLVRLAEVALLPVLDDRGLLDLEFARQLEKHGAFYAPPQPNLFASIEDSLRLVQ